MKVEVKVLFRILLLGTFFSLFSCAHDPHSVSIIDASDQTYGVKKFKYTVKKGDTLYGIAFKYGTTAKEISRLNGIKKPYTIFPNQSLLIYGEAPIKPKPKKQVAKPKAKAVKPKVVKVAPKPPPPVTAPVKEVASVAVVPKPAPAAKPKSVTPATNQATPKVSPSKSVASASEKWLPPTTAKRGASFTLGKTSHKGIDYHGQYGSAVKASKSGTVVYAGSGLKAYGLLIIIKHDKDYLSAYAYNKKLLVKEGEFVQQNQIIAEMGKKGDKVTLHFEIRRSGKSVNPDSLLSK